MSRYIALYRSMNLSVNPSKCVLLCRRSSFLFLSSVSFLWKNVPQAFTLKLPFFIFCPLYFILSFYICVISILSFLSLLWYWSKPEILDINFISKFFRTKKSILNSKRIHFFLEKVYLQKRKYQQEREGKNLNPDLMQKHSIHYSSYRASFFYIICWEKDFKIHSLNQIQV